MTVSLQTGPEFGRRKESDVTHNNEEVFELEPLDTPKHTQVGHWISFHPYVSPTARQLYVILAGFVNHHQRQQGNTAAYPSMNLMAMLLGLSRSDKVTPYIDELIWLGAVAKRTQRTHGGMRARNIYGVRFNPPPNSDLPESLEQILKPHQDLLKNHTTKELGPLMSAHAKDCKEKIQHSRAQVKAGRTRQDNTTDQDTDRAPQNRGTTNQDEQTKPQVSPYPQKQGSRTPKNRGSVPPKKGVEQYVGRTRRRTNNKKTLPTQVPTPSATDRDAVSDDGQAVADALSNKGWDTDDIKAALPEGVKVTGPGLERIATRCRELADWGLDTDQINQLLAGAPKNNPDKSLLRRTATPQDAHQALAGNRDVEGARQDVDQVCEHLAQTVANLGFTRPSITREWRRAARLMIDNDHAPSVDEHGNPISKKITAEAIMRMIDWVGHDPFWGAKGNIRSMPKLRTQFETLAAQARQKSGQGASTSPSGGFRTRWQQQEEYSRYGAALEMSMDYVLGLDDASYRQDLAEAKMRGGHEGMTAFREKVFGPRSGWSPKVTRKRLETLFGRIRQAGYRMRDNELSQNRKESWAQALAESGESVPDQEPDVQSEPEGPGAEVQVRDGSAQGVQGGFDPQDPEQQPGESRDDWAERYMLLQRRKYAHQEPSRLQAG